VIAPSRGVYELVFVGRSGEAFPSGVELNATIGALEPMDEHVLDRDLWAIRRAGQSRREAVEGCASTAPMTFSCD
jgi:hypothetical protein